MSKGRKPTPSFVRSFLACRAFVKALIPCNQGGNSYISKIVPVNNLTYSSSLTFSACPLTAFAASAALFALASFAS